MNEEFGDLKLVQGTLAPSSEEVAIASEIIQAVDKKPNMKPIDVAGFLLEVAKGKYGDSWRPYTRAWPVDASANPLILDFFRATNAHPEGDTTAWCAAFVNWCLLKSYKGNPPKGASLPTNSAASASFRTWGKEALLYDAASSTLAGSFEPRPGDIVVFEEIRPNGIPDPVHGHVTFFVEMDDDRIRVLGGNQFEGKPIVHAINSKWMSKSGKLQLHSIRRDPGL